MAKKKLQVVERKLGREKAFGQCYQNLGLIEIDPRQTAKEYLDTLIHEMLHHELPELSEREVERLANTFSHVIWKHNYRRIMC